MTSVWCKLIITRGISAHLLCPRRRGLLFSPLMPTCCLLVYYVAGAEGDPPWAKPFFHFGWYRSCRRSCDNRFVSQIGSFTLCSRLKCAVWSSRRGSGSGGCWGRLLPGSEAYPGRFSISYAFRCLCVEGCLWSPLCIYSVVLKMTREWWFVTKNFQAKWSVMISNADTK